MCVSLTGWSPVPPLDPHECSLNGHFPLFQPMTECQGGKPQISLLLTQLEDAFVMSPLSAPPEHFQYPLELRRELQRESIFTDNPRPWISILFKNVLMHCSTFTVVQGFLDLCICSWGLLLDWLVHLNLNEMNNVHAVYFGKSFNQSIFCGI